MKIKCDNTALKKFFYLPNHLEIVLDIDKTHIETLNGDIESLSEN